jgi:hypothetical protein
MTVINAADLERLRNTHPHKIIPHLSVFKPEPLFCGTVTGSPAMGEHQITVVDVSGSWAAVDAAAPDLMAYVGDSCGTHEKSKRRLRSRVGQVITLDENSVEWANGDVITIMHSYDLWSVFPYIDPDTKTFYKDLDIPYTDENELMRPVAIMGPHQAKFLDGPSVVFNLDGSDSYAIAQGASITGYYWQATGGVIADSGDPTTTITFTAPGTYIITLTVTDSNQKTQQTRRVYFVHQRTGAYAPYSDFDFERSPEGSWEAGGWNCGIRVKGVADQDEFPDNALCVLWAEMFWDNEEYYIVDGYNNLMVGYITRENIVKELDTGFVVFDIATIHEMMKNARCFSVSLEYDPSPDTWWKMDDLTVARAVHHVWRWHSTLFTVTDVYLPILTSNTQLLKAVDDFEGGDLYSIVDNFTYKHSIFAHVVCNKHGQIYVEQDFAMLDEADRAAGTASVVLSDRDRRGPADVDFARKTPERVSHAIVSGTYFDGTEAIPVIAQAPGYVPSPWGDGQASFERLVIDSQAYANMIAGRVIAVANEKILDVEIPLAGDWLPALDITPQNWVQLNVQAADTKRGVSLEGYYHLRKVTAEISLNGSCLVDINLIPEAFGPDGVPGPYPDDWPWPTFPLPDFPEFPPWAFPRWDTLMVRNEHNDGVLPYTPYQGTVINDPSTILPANDGEEVTNLLAYSEHDSPVKFVTDGISIFFHQFEYDWGDPTSYDFRIWRHDIATGAADYLSFPYDDGSAYFWGLTCIDIGIVGVLVSTWLGVPGTDIYKLYEMNFNTGEVSVAYSYSNNDVNVNDYCYTVQSTVNVYTVFGTGLSESGQPYKMVTHRYNWTTGVGDYLETWVNPDSVKGGLNAAPFPPVVAGYEIYWGTNLNTSSPRGKGYIHWYNFVTREYGSKLIFHSGVSSGIKFYHSGYYRDLNRIYFMVREYTGSYYVGAYISTLTKEVTYIDVPTDHSSPDEMYKYVGNKQKCWRLDWYNAPAVQFIDLSDGAVKLVGSMGDDHGAYYYEHPKIWSAQVDDIDERIWSFQGHYIIGQGESDTIIAETGITPPTGVDWEYMESYLYVLGRTFVVMFYDWNTSYKRLYAVHYPGSIVIE